MQDEHDYCQELHLTDEQTARVKAQPFLEDPREGQTVIGYFHGAGLFRGPLVALEHWDKEDGPALGLVDSEGIYPVGAAFFLCADFNYND